MSRINVPRNQLTVWPVFSANGNSQARMCTAPSYPGELNMHLIFVIAFSAKKSVASGSLC